VCFVDTRIYTRKRISIHESDRLFTAIVSHISYEYAKCGMNTFKLEAVKMFSLKTIHKYGGDK
jgi:hypothetical protein